MKALKQLRIIGTLEAISYLLLLGIAMPLKYLAGWPLAVKYVGWAHGLLFMLFLGWAAYVAWQRKWPFKQLIYAFLAALLPFGPFVWDRRFLAREEKAAAAA
jgi:integral membrane protein